MFGQPMSDTSQDDQSMLPAGPLDDTMLGDPSFDSHAPNPAANHTTGMPNQAEPTSNTMPTMGTSVTDTSLISLKQQVLQDLKPLVGHLEQNPEEKFRTTMMMIQASDDDNLIPEAYEAAKAIHDEKARAQALLDVVNEINYFTSQKKQDS